MSARQNFLRELERSRRYRVENPHPTLEQIQEELRRLTRLYWLAYGAPREGKPTQ